MLLVTTTMGMVNRVHSHTTDTWVVILLGVALPPGGTSLEERLVSALTTGNDADHSTAATLNGLTDTRRKTDARLHTILGVTNNDSGGAGGAGIGATVTKLGLNIGDDSAFGHGGDRQNVANGEGSFASAVDEHASVHALNGNEVLAVVFVAILVPEDNLGERSATARIVEDVLHNTLDVALAFGEVESAEAGRGDALASAAFEDGRRAMALRSDHFSHD